VISLQRETKAYHHPRLTGSLIPLLLFQKALLFLPVLVYCPEEQIERDDKVVRLNGFRGPLLPKTRAKPTIRIKRYMSYIFLF
jgi:hypothetical protein